MTNRHDAEHGALLQQVLAGDLGRDDPEVVRRVAACARCGDELAVLDELTAELDEAGAEERELVARARALVREASAQGREASAQGREASAQGREASARGREASARGREASARGASAPSSAARAGPAPATAAPFSEDGSRQGARRTAAERPAARRRLRLAVPLAAAAVLLVTYVVWVRVRPGEPASSDGSFELGGGGADAMAPAGEVATFARPFTWTLESGEGGWFEVRVRVHRGDGEPGPIVATSGRLDAPPWTPDEREARAWPPDILWEVRGFDATGNVTGSAERRAWRSSP